VLAARRADPLGGAGVRARGAGARRAHRHDRRDGGPRARGQSRRSLRRDRRLGEQRGRHVFGRFEDIPHDAYRRVLETNLLGYIYGAWAALPHLRARRGVLINVGSVNSRVPAPFVSPYIASKFAVEGWTGSLRQELRSTGVRVAAVLPASIDTPLFDHAGNWFGRRPKPLESVNDPERVARAIVRCARRPPRELLVGRGARAMVAMEALGAPLFERVFAKQVERNHFLDEPAGPSPGNLFEPLPKRRRDDRWLARAPAPAPIPGARASRRRRARRPGIAARARQLRQLRTWRRTPSGSSALLGPPASWPNSGVRRSHSSPPLIAAIFPRNARGPSVNARLTFVKRPSLAQAFRRS
jgi:NAD(P)-dependent dehydrogenase (short-subunit alcohol dehydrogenase family)